MGLLRRWEIPPEQRRTFFTRCAMPADYVPGADPKADKRLLDKVNAEWKRLGDKMGFKWNTVRPIPDWPQEFFLAEPKDN